MTAPDKGLAELAALIAEALADVAAAREFGVGSGRMVMAGSLSRKADRCRRCEAGAVQPAIAGRRSTPVGGSSATGR